MMFPMEILIPGETSHFLFFRRHGIVARIRTEEGKVVVETGDLAVREAVDRLVQQLMDGGDLMVQRHFMERYENGRPRRHTAALLPVTPDQRDFLFTLMRVLVHKPNVRAGRTTLKLSGMEIRAPSGKVLLSRSSPSVRYYAPSE